MNDIKNVGAEAFETRRFSKIQEIIVIIYAENYLAKINSLKIRRPTSLNALKAVSGKNDPLFKILPSVDRLQIMNNQEGTLEKEPVELPGIDSENSWSENNNVILSKIVTKINVLQELQIARDSP